MVETGRTVASPGVLTTKDRAKLDQLRRASLALSEARLVLLGPAYANQIPDEKIDEVLDVCTRIMTAVMRIDSAQLSLIIRKIDPNIAALRKATAELEVEIRSVRRINQVLQLATAVLGIISKFLVVF